MRHGACSLVRLLGPRGPSCQKPQEATEIGGPEALQPFLIPDEKRGASAFSFFMSFHPVGRCKCGHVKSIHLRMAYKAKRRLDRPCNFPDCKCKDYIKGAFARSKVVGEVGSSLPVSFDR